MTFERGFEKTVERRSSDAVFQARSASITAGMSRSIPSPVRAETATSAAPATCGKSRSSFSRILEIAPAGFSIEVPIC